MVYIGVFKPDIVGLLWVPLYTVERIVSGCKMNKILDKK